VADERPPVVPDAALVGAGTPSETAAPV